MSRDYAGRFGFLAALEKAPDREGEAAWCVADTERQKFPTDWSSDGRFITYSSQAPDYRYLHTWIVSRFVASKQLELQIRPRCASRGR